MRISSLDLRVWAISMSLSNGQTKHPAWDSWKVYQEDGTMIELLVEKATSF